MDSRCTSCSALFSVTDEDRAFHRNVSPVIAGKTYEIPPPTLCPDCRQQRRIAFRNDSHYYKNTCHLCKKSIVSIYSPDKPVNVLCSACFWSDRWDPLSFGTELDISRSFFEQYAAMRRNVPRLSIFNTQSDNADYTVHSSKNRNCYMGSSLVNSEDTYYSDWAIRCRDCADLLMCTDMELCYMCNDSRGCFNGDFLDLCSNCSDSFLCFDCHGSHDLVGCVSIRNGSSMILNTRAPKDEVKKTIARLKTDSVFRKEFEAKFRELSLSLPKREAWNLNAENSSGNYIMNARNAHHAYHVVEVEDCAYAYDAVNAKDCMDLMRGSGGEMLYDCKGIIDLKNSCFCNLTYQCDHLLYCDNCHGSSECFGCFGLKKQKYCILNKQYTKEEYEKLVPKIIEHMKKRNEYGEFFPVTLSPFGYNETKAQDWFPLTKDEVLRRGWNWSDYEQPVPTDLKTIDGNRLPEKIEDVPDDILNYIISCAVTKKPFRLVPQELAFYRKKGLPVPRVSPAERMRQLNAHQNPRTLHARVCAKCDKDIMTTYPPNGPEIVYCERCYLETVK